METVKISYCGLLCSECDNYIFNKDHKETAREVSCNGCREGKKCKFPAQCNVRKCSMLTGIDNCTYCPEFPCDKIENIFYPK